MAGVAAPGVSIVRLASDRARPHARLA